MGILVSLAWWERNLLGEKSINQEIINVDDIYSILSGLIYKKKIGLSKFGDHELHAWMLLLWGNPELIPLLNL
jgi:hypothetical protein